MNSERSVFTRNKKNLKPCAALRGLCVASYLAGTSPVWRSEQVLLILVRNNKKE